MVAPSAGALLPAGPGCTVVGRNATSPGPLPFPAVTVTGTPGNDVICLLGIGGQLFNRNDVLPTFALNGDDTIYGTPGIDILFGGDGDDVIFGYQGDDFIDGGDGDDKAFGSSGNDTITGGPGNDLLNGDSGNDDLYGEEDNDTLNGGTGADYMEGGDDEDELFGGDGADEMHGNDGEDYLTGQNGNDLLFGGEGNDTINGNDGQDLIFGDSDDLPNELAGCCGQVPAGPDALGFQWWVWSTDFNYWAIEESRISAMDTINGGRDDDFIDGEIGTDTITGDQGDDIVWGGLGSDSISGAWDEDDLHGDEGFWRQGIAAVTVDWDGTQWPVILPAFTKAQVKALFAGMDGADKINGGSEDDTLDGGPGLDALDGADGTDTCFPNVGGGSVANCELVI